MSTLHSHTARPLARLLVQVWAVKASPDRSHICSFTHLRVLQLCRHVKGEVCSQVEGHILEQVTWAV